jgi:hypothetical protein
MKLFLVLIFVLTSTMVFAEGETATDCIWAKQDGRESGKTATSQPSKQKSKGSTVVRE